MRNTLVKKSEIMFSKSKFFFTRTFVYFSFLLFPIWIQKTLFLNRSIQILMMIFYIMFMVSQWFLLGKEIDHRFKNYFRVNSSFDRVVYRLFLGMFFIILYFNILVNFPHKWIYNMFWVTWVILGLFYSWPTRGKIIKESVTTNFNEFRYLDPIEKALLFLIIIFFGISIPEIPEIMDQNSLMIFLDPENKLSSSFWNFMIVNYYPFKKYPELLNLAWGMHFYCVGIGGFLMVFYAMIRYFFSRRNSLLGIFALISSWSFSKILANDLGHSVLTTYSILWIWMLLWVVRSSSYKVGLFTGLVGYWGCILNKSFAPLAIIQSLLLHFVLLKEQTQWFRKKFFKYSLFGIFLAFIYFFNNFQSISGHNILNISFFESLVSYVSQKAIYSVSIFGVVFIFQKIIFPGFFERKNININGPKIFILIISYCILLVYSSFFSSDLVSSFSLLWPIVFLTLFPLEMIFQSVARLKSRRNLIYIIYVLVCLLDSHFEGRLKIFLRLIAE